MTQRLSVTGMTCQHCVKRLTDALRKVPGVLAVTVSLSPPEAKLEVRDKIEPEALNDAVQAAGDFELLGLE